MNKKIGLVLGLCLVAVCASAMPVTNINITDDGKTATQAKVEKANQVVNGWGKEIGTALREAGTAFVSTTDGALTVTENHLTKFADSRAGKFTMVVIGWHFFGKELMGYGIGLMVLIILSTAIWKTHNKLFLRQCVIKSETKQGWWSTDRVYAYEDPIIDWEGSNYLVALLAQVITIWITCAIMF